MHPSYGRQTWDATTAGRFICFAVRSNFFEYRRPADDCAPRSRRRQQIADGGFADRKAQGSAQKAQGDKASRALELARQGRVSRATATALHRALLRAERSCAAGAPPAAARAARINLAAALITWGRRSRRPARMHRKSERLLLAALREDPSDALALANLAVLKANRRLRAAESAASARAAEKGEQVKEEREGESGLGSCASDPDRACKKPTPKYLHAESQDGLHTPRADDPRGDGRRRWLAIGVPTVPRQGDPGYLARTLRAIAVQLPTRDDDPLHGQVAAAATRRAAAAEGPSGGGSGGEAEEGREQEERGRAGRWWWWCSTTGRGPTRNSTGCGRRWRRGRTPGPSGSWRRTSPTRTAGRRRCRGRGPPSGPGCGGRRGRWCLCCALRRGWRRTSSSTRTTSSCARTACGRWPTSRPRRTRTFPVGLCSLPLRPKSLVLVLALHSRYVVDVVGWRLCAAGNRENLDTALPIHHPQAILIPISTFLLRSVERENPT